MAGRQRTSVHVIGSRQLTELHTALRREANGKERIKALRRELKDAAKPIPAAIKANIRAMPSQGQNARRGKPSLRREMARSVTTQIRFRGSKTGVYVYMNPRKMPDGKKSLPGYFEQTPGHTRFKHKVFGNPDKWVIQYPPQPGYFTRTLDGVERQVSRRIENVIDQTQRNLEG